MKTTITGKVLFLYAILFKLFQSCCYGLSPNVTQTSILTNYSVNLSATAFKYVSSSSIYSAAFPIIGLSTKTIVAPSSTIGVNKTFHYPGSTLPIYHQSTALIRPTSSKEFVLSTNSFTKHQSASPTLKTPPNTTAKSKEKTKSGLHKVGLVIGIVSGLVILCLCLIVFHKKEARLRCLKLLLKPCTKNYSRYNIVPIYVYDDNEQDIRELQDDSDLPLV